MAATLKGFIHGHTLSFTGEEGDASSQQVPETLFILYVQLLSPSTAHLYLRVHVHPLQNPPSAFNFKI